MTAALFSDDDAPTLAELPVVEKELLVQTFPGAGKQELAEVYSEVGAQLVETIPQVDMAVLRIEEGDVTEVGTRLADSGLFENVQKNYVFEVTATPDDPLFSSQSYLTQVGVPKAWDITTGSQDVIIAVVDTGIDENHADLRDKVIGGYNIYDDNDDYDDIVGHGTSVAGLAAASADNGTGVAGISWESPILAVKVTDEEGMSTARHLAAGILWAAGNGAKIINVSFAPLQSNSVVRSAVEHVHNRGAIVVISSGNSGKTLKGSGYSQALFVGAVTSTDRIASFSDRGSYVDLVAPGSGVRSIATGGGTSLVSGTSFSAPIVSGVAALAWSVNPDLRPISVQNILTTAVSDLGTRGKDSTYGHGMVDAAKAVEEALDTTATEDTGPPELAVTSPKSGSTRSGRFRASVTATDDEGVADVVLSIDGVPFATDTRSPYRFLVNPNQFSTGNHELSFVATDFSGNASSPKTITVKFGASQGGQTNSTATDITFTSPAEGSSVRNSVTIKASVSDPDGLATVEWFVDGVSKVVNAVGSTSSSVSFVWQATGETRGTHTITLVAIDAYGNMTSAGMELTKR